MNILFYRYGSICEPDVIDGFLELGHQVSEITEEITNKTLLPSQTILLISEYLGNDPHDLVFTINFYPAISEVCTLLKIPYVCWIVDSPVLELYTTSVTNPYNRIFLFDYTMYQEFAPLNPSCIFYLPLAVNVNAKQAVIWNTDADTRHSYASDVTFLGSLYSEKCPYDTLHHPSDYSRGYLDAIMQTQLKIYGYYFIEDLLNDSLIESYRNCNPDFFFFPADSYLTDRITLSLYYIGNKITALERDTTMRLLSENFSTTIYTGSDTSMYPKLHNRGFAKTLTEMPVIFHESKININTTSKPIRSGLPLRIWDILGSGGFVLSNYQSEIPDLLQIGEHLDTYGSMEELLEKCEYYLAHDKIRKEIAENGFKEVAAYHTYVHRLQTLLELAFNSTENEV